MKAMNHRAAKRRPAQRNQRGLALMELLLLTVPLCILSIVLASAVAATSTAKNKSMWQASRDAQLATRQRCGAPTLFTKVALTPKYGNFISGMGKAREIALIGLPITQTGTKTVESVEKVAPFYFETAADKMFASRSREAKNSATFPCNEPGDPGDSDRNKYKAVLIVRGIAKAREMY